MNRSRFIRLALGGALATGLLTSTAHAADAGKPFKIGFILPMTGQSASTGKQIEAAAKLYMAQNSSTVAGRKVELIIKDDAGVADGTRRIAQELVVNDKVDVLAGFGLTPLALAAAPIATQSKTPMVVTAAATSIITEQSPYIVRTSFTLPQVTLGIAEWAGKNKIKRAVTHMLAVFPFEEAIYEKAGIPVSYVGHPLADRMLADVTEVIETRFWEEQNGAIAEEFNADWSPISTSLSRFLASLIVISIIGSLTASTTFLYW